MKHLATTLLAGSTLIVVLAHSLSAQILPLDRPTIQKRYLHENEGAVSTAELPTVLSAPRGYARYTAKDWRRSCGRSR